MSSLPCLTGIPNLLYVARSKSSFNGAELELIIRNDDRSYLSTMGSFASNTTTSQRVKNARILMGGATWANVTPYFCTTPNHFSSSKRFITTTFKPIVRDNNKVNDNGLWLKVVRNKVPDMVEWKDACKDISIS